MSVNTKIYRLSLGFLLLCIAYSLYTYYTLKDKNASLTEIISSIDERQYHEVYTSFLYKQFEKRKSWKTYRDSFNNFRCEIDIFRNKIEELNTSQIHHLINLIPTVDMTRTLKEEDFCYTLEFFSENRSNTTLSRYYYDMLTTDLLNVWLVLFTNSGSSCGINGYMPILENRGKQKAPLLYFTYQSNSFLNRYYCMIDNKLLPMHDVAVYPVKKNAEGDDSINIKLIYHDRIADQVTIKDYLKYY